MSASEELRKFQGPLLRRGIPFYFFDSETGITEEMVKTQARYHSALPLIADVVEAAETYATVIDMPLMDKVLAALREHLEQP